MASLTAACLLAGTLLMAGVARAGQEQAVDLELVLAVDVSGSIDAEEARQQREGYIAAIADPAVVQAIHSNFHPALTTIRLPGAEDQ
jgi:hypothetical protein